LSLGYSGSIAFDENRGPKHPNQSAFAAQCSGFFRPGPTLATYSIEPTVNVRLQNRYYVTTTAQAAGVVWEWGGLLTAAWEISRVDGSLSLVQPVGIATLFRERFENQTPSPVHESWVSRVITTNLMLQAARTYLIGVIPAVQIDNLWTMSDGSPMQPLPTGSEWKVWSSITGRIPKAHVRQTIVYVP